MIIDLLELREKMPPYICQLYESQQEEKKDHFRSRKHLQPVQIQEEFLAMLEIAKKKGRQHGMDSGKFVSTS